jgi:hypothetical protein
VKELQIHDDAISAMIVVRTPNGKELWTGSWDSTSCVVTCEHAGDDCSDLSASWESSMSESDSWIDFIARDESPERGTRNINIQPLQISPRDVSPRSSPRSSPRDRKSQSPRLFPVNHERSSLSDLMGEEVPFPAAKRRRSPSLKNRSPPPLHRSPSLSTKLTTAPLSPRSPRSPRSGEWSRASDEIKPPPRIILHHS